MPTTVRRLVVLTALAVLIGLAGGGAAFLLYHLIALLTNAALLHRLGWGSIPSFEHVRFGWSLVPVAALGGLCVSLLARWSPIIRGHGIPEAMEAILTRQSRIRPRTAIAKPLSAAIAIGTGGPFGAEGPIIVTGGAIGSLVGQVIDVSPSERKILLAAGAAAGMAATFGTPLAAVLLALELLLFEFSSRAFIPLVVASTVAAGVHTLIFGSGPLFSVPAHDFAGLQKLPAFAVLGVACGLLAVLVTKGLFTVEAAYRRLPVSEFWHPVIGAVLFAAIGLAVPMALGVGYPAISDVLHDHFGAWTLASLLIAKLVAWWIALGSGTSGGTLAPILLVAGSFGSLVGLLAERLQPGLHLAPGAFALVAMAAVFGAATRATFTSIVFLFELTRDYQIILPLMLASVLADLVAMALMRESLMTEKLVRRGLRVHGDYEVDVLRTATVGELMTRAVQTLPAAATVRDAARRFDATRHGALPLVDEHGACVGIVTRGDVIAAPADPDTPVAEVATRQIISVSPADPALEAVRRMIEEGVEHLPVAERGRLVGICTRTDILRARRRQFEHEVPEAGWGRALRSRLGRGTSSR